MWSFHDADDHGYIYSDSLITEKALPIAAVYGFPFTVTASFRFSDIVLGTTTSSPGASLTFHNHTTADCHLRIPDAAILGYGRNAMSPCWRATFTIAPCFMFAVADHYLLPCPTIARSPCVQTMRCISALSVVSPSPDHIETAPESPEIT